MRISNFIRSEIDLILEEWDRFARCNAPIESHLTDLVLRDHAREMLIAVAADIESPQSPDQQERKSQGLETGTRIRSAATIHGSQRHLHEFSLVQLGAEFRALRSTVLRLWLPQVGAMSESTVHEVIRFNEAIDQAIAESTMSYVEATRDAQNMFLAVLGHDLRSPLATMSVAGQILTTQDRISSAQRSQLAHSVERSAKLMKSMVDDLLGYTRVQFGKGLPVEPAWCDVAEVLRNAMGDAKSTYPQTHYEWRVTGDLAACYDATRLHQLFVNLLVNAAQHGAKTRPVMIEASGTADQVTVHITNGGNVIPEASLKSIFKPLVQLAPETSDTRPSTSLGLGLFIARVIAEGHGGTVDVRSDTAAGTTFTVKLPRDVTCQRVSN